MSAHDKTGGAAFPRSATEGDTWFQRGAAGMTLRDYFAGKAMEGYLTHAACADSECSLIAKWAYEMADAMLAARNEEI